MTTFEQLAAQYEAVQKSASEAHERLRNANKEIATMRKERDDAAAAAKAERESYALRDGLRRAGVADENVKYAVEIMRGESSAMTFGEDGALKYAVFQGRSFHSAAELANAVVGAFPSMSSAYTSAAHAANGSAPHDSMSAVQLAELGLERYAPQIAPADLPRSTQPGAATGIAAEIERGLEGKV
jgi:hypothetical protein